MDAVRSDKQGASNRVRLNRDREMVEESQAAARA